MGWLVTLLRLIHVLSSGTSHSKSSLSSDSKSELLYVESPPSPPFECRVPSDTNADLHYVVSVDLNDRWTCSCPDFVNESKVTGRLRYFCKHCITVARATGLKDPKRWKSRNGMGWLIGEIEQLANGNSRMVVDGYVTSRQLYEDFHLTDALRKKFFADADDEAMFFNAGEHIGGCLLYASERVDRILKSDEFKIEWEKTQKRRESAKKGSAKRQATLQSKREREEERLNKIRKAFGGAIYDVQCDYAYGSTLWKVYAKDESHAIVLTKRWLESEDGKVELNSFYEDALEDYKEIAADYREALRDGYTSEELNKPLRPKKSDFTFRVRVAVRTDDEISDYSPEDVFFEDGDSWDHDIFR